MIIPVRCITCGKPMAGLWEKYKERVDKVKAPGKVLDDLKVKRYCCRAMLMTHTDSLKRIAKFRV